jgi:hypothetical protein
MSPTVAVVLPCLTEREALGLSKPGSVASAAVDSLGEGA